MSFVLCRLTESAVSVSSHYVKLTSPSVIASYLPYRKNPINILIHLPAKEPKSFFPKYQTLNYTYLPFLVFTQGHCLLSSVLSFQTAHPNIFGSAWSKMASFVKIQSAFVCFSSSSRCEARQYWMEKVLTQWEGRCQINNEDRPRKAVEEATEMKQGVLIVQPTEVCVMHL